MVPQALLDEKMQELLAKDETIQVVLRRNGTCRLIEVQRLGTKFCWNFLAIASWVPQKTTFNTVPVQGLDCKCDPCVH